MRFAQGTSVAVALALTAATAGCGGSDAQADPAAPVVKDFTSYSTAVTEKDGATAADLMSATSITYYDGLRTLALDADRRTLAARPVIDQLSAYSLRADLEPQDLRTLSPHDLVMKAVETSLISNAATPEEGLQQVKVNGATSTAQLVMAEGAQYPVAFTHEAGHWKFDITSLLAPAASAMDQARTNQKLTEAELVDQVLVTRYGRGRARALYRPLD